MSTLNALCQQVMLQVNSLCSISTANPLYQHNLVGQQLIFMSTVDAVYQSFFSLITDTLCQLLTLNSYSFMSTVNVSHQQLMLHVNSYWFMSTEVVTSPRAAKIQSQRNMTH